MIKEITVDTLYDLTRVFLKNRVSAEVWISKGLSEMCKPAIDKAMETGVKIHMDNTKMSNESGFMVAGYAFIEKPNIEGLMCFSEGYHWNGIDTSIRQILEHEAIEKLKVQHNERQARLFNDEICIGKNVVLNIHPSTRYSFEFFGWRSVDMTTEMALFIEYAKGRKCLLDIGALYGIFSLVFSEINKDSKVHAFEPEPTAFSLLSFNASVNRGDVYTYCVALSDNNGVILMDKEWEHYITSENGAHEVVCKNGDDFCLAHKVLPDTLKIDTEGSELKVLKGLRYLLLANHPMIFLELHPERMNAQGDSVSELVDFLKCFDYEAIDTRTNEPISYAEIGLIKDMDLRLILI
jgi:FkbM family methyltransferase